MLARIAFVSLVLALVCRAENARPNILFIASDDMRPQLGCYGDPVVKSPNIDRLAARGMVFQRAFCQQALCSPSRISLLSGRRTAKTQIWEIGPTLRSKMPDITTLPQHFKNSGYFTRSIGKVYHVGIDDPDSWSVPSEQAKMPRMGPTGRKAQAELQAQYKAKGMPVPKRGAGNLSSAVPAFEAVDCNDDELIDGDCARRAVDILKDLAKAPEKPFFFAVGFANPHVPWVSPKKYFDLYEREKLVIPANDFAPRGSPVYAATTGNDFHWYAGVPEAQKLPDDFARQCLQGYYAAISYVDAQVGRLLDALDQTGLAKNTIVVFWGDHGYYMGEHSWWGGKHNNYEGATRVALIMATPGQKTAGQKTRSIVEFVDIYPTLTELCGLPKPKDAADLDGTSLVPLLNDPSASVKDAAFSQYPKGGNLGTAMRTDRWRYVEWHDKSGKLVDRELYDHDADPEENQNLANDPEQSATITTLSQKLSATGMIKP